MELHYSGRDDRKLALVGLIYGILSVPVGALLGLVLGGLGWAFALFGWVTGFFAFLAGAVVLVMSFRPFRIALDDAGLTVRSEGHRFDGPWDLVEAINIEQTSVGEPPETRRLLVLWVREEVRMRHRPSYPHGGVRKGHVLVDLGNIRESPDEVAAILDRYAKTRFRTMAQV
ncbi:hypothetical protein [Phytohabitans rumicis]|uniref:PH domain-containing protein n=1 Tax=Phytohabitans rumicis TaxID=1076125 RepID=A0A6V8L9W8_9ACTN|nr:hypothetical protein [Phytohabitans rumicis]GFJ93134.1 hypothetical protein Prum_067760 [Phytohabitans rumicis]